MVTESFCSYAYVCWCPVTVLWIQVTHRPHSVQGRCLRLLGISHSSSQKLTAEEGTGQHRQECSIEMKALTSGVRFKLHINGIRDKNSWLQDADIAAHRAPGRYPRDLATEDSLAQGTEPVSVTRTSWRKPRCLTHTASHLPASLSPNTYRTKDKMLTTAPNSEVEQHDKALEQCSVSNLEAHGEKQYSNYT